MRNAPRKGQGILQEGRAVSRRGKNAGLMHADESVAYKLRDTYRTITRAFHAESETLHAGADISVWIFLRSFLKEEWLTQKELAHRLGLMQPGASAALKQLEGRGLLTKITDPEDRRKVRISLTAKSRELTKELMPTAAKVLKQAMTGFSKQEAALLFEMLDRIKANFDTATGTGAGKPGNTGVAKVSRAARGDGTKSGAR